ncbi:DUF2884 family protein [Luteimonas sp. MC1572]|uniref:DUF2884 family protein n=1 Tax=Luteimonas sp. MC1572 TaxID=2799325 RepID=UPI0018F0E1A7|nr:DUF2884 family protein [Luteimonas sp. MC1572]MBJ6982228.1 DUF2884 family protein [Luteimonas sp. MC1572]QQO03505.1 DUF2884 family protein [Luteimonas sp. MC1572]
MRKIAIAASLMLACGGVAAADVSVDCDIDSDYDFHLSEKSVILLDRGASPHTVLVRKGRLFIDDRWVQVSDADARRLVDYEREARAAMPLAASVARQAAGIAFEVLGEVAAGFGSDPDAARQKFAGVRRELDAALAASVTPSRFNREQLNDAIGAAVAQAVPALVGDIVGGALRAAFSGDASRLQRLESLDAEIEALVEPRARALEADAQALCRRMEALDAIDDALEFRLPDGRALDLHRVDTGSRAAGG